MKCETCGNQKTVLLYSAVCDYCEGIKEITETLGGFKWETIEPSWLSLPSLPFQRIPPRMDREIFPVASTPEKVKQLFYDSDFSKLEFLVMASMPRQELDEFFDWMGYLLE